MKWSRSGQLYDRRTTCVQFTTGLAGSARANDIETTDLDRSDLIIDLPDSVEGFLGQNVAVVGRSDEQDRGVRRA